MKQNQKPIILAALAVVLLGVGAFTFLPQLAPPKPAAVASKSSPATVAKSLPAATAESPADPAQDPATEEKAKDPMVADPTKGPQQPLTPEEQARADELSKLRDPFAKPSNVSGINPGLTTTAPPEAAPAQGAPAESVPAQARTPRAGSGSQPWLQPLNPVGGSLPSVGSQPLPMGGGDANGVGVPVAQVKGPRYRLKGVLRGQVPVAVLEDADGNQRIVRIGEMCDASTKVTRISSGQVTLVEKGKEKTLVIEEQAG